MLQPPSSSPSSSSRLSLILLAGAVVVAVALTLSVVGLTRAGTVSVLPVTAQQTGIAVCGHGEATARPDQAQIQAGVHATAPTAQEARAQAAQAMAAVLAALKSNGVAENDIQTTYFAIAPQYVYNAGTNQLSGSIATNSVTATIRSVESAGKVVDAVTQAGSNQVTVSGIQFSKGDPSQALAEAEQHALDDARRQAEVVAARAGVSLGTAVSVQVGSCAVSSPQPLYGTANQARDASSTPFQPGQESLAVDVLVVYAIR